MATLQLLDSLLGIGVGKWLFDWISLGFNIKVLMLLVLTVLMYGIFDIFKDCRDDNFFSSNLLLTTLSPFYELVPIIICLAY